MPPGGTHGNGERLFVEQVNLLTLHQRVNDLISNGPVGDDFVFSPDLVLEFHGLAMRNLLPSAGKYRHDPVFITSRDHKPPPWEQVPSYMADLTTYMNKHWHDRDLVHLSAFALWRLCWIHPFEDGNGRTAREIAYLVLSAKHGKHLPPKNTIIEQIRHDKQTLGIEAPYYKALGIVDQKHKDCDTRCSDCDGECTCSHHVEVAVLGYLKEQIRANLQ